MELAPWINSRSQDSKSTSKNKSPEELTSQICVSKPLQPFSKCPAQCNGLHSQAIPSNTAISSTAYPHPWELGKQQTSSSAHLKAPEQIPFKSLLLFSRILVKPSCKVKSMLYFTALKPQQKKKICCWCFPVTHFAVISTSGFHVKMGSGDFQPLFDTSFCSFCCLLAHVFSRLSVCEMRLLCYEVLVVDFCLLRSSSL